MSARPRPVTATFPPAPLLSPVLLKPRSRSPSPLNSTASLLSVLNHNSYESGASPITHLDDVRFKAVESQNAFTKHFTKSISVRQTNWDEECLITEQQDNSVRQNVKLCKPSASAATRVRDLKRSKSMDAARIKNAQIISSKQLLNKNSSDARKFDDCSEVVAKAANSELSAWEKWIIQKAKENRSKTEQEMKQRQMKLNGEEMIRKQKEDKKKMEEIVIKDWMKEHDLQKKQKVNAEMQRISEEKELKEKEKKFISEKSEVKFNEWLQKKIKEKTKLRKETAERMGKELEDKENRQKRSEEAFNEWFRKAQSRPRTAPHSYGYTDGKLTGYYDAGAYPIPNYINPVPWQPIDIPKRKSVDKRNNSRRLH